LYIYVGRLIVVLKFPQHWHRNQGYQMAYFQTKNPKLGKLWRVLQYKMLVYFIPFGLLYGHLVYFVAVWYVIWLFAIYFSRFGFLYGYLIYIFPILVCCTKKNLATLIATFDARIGSCIHRKVLRYTRDPEIIGL
jgi:hypothetical protein